MPEQDELVLEQPAGAAADPAHSSEPAKAAGAVPGATDAQEKVAETDEQKNERVAREAQEKAEKRSRGVQKRIDELTAEKHAERKRADDLQDLLRQQLEGKAQSKAGAKTGEPTRDQHPDLSYEDFLLLRAEWRAEQKASSVSEQSRKTTDEQRQREAQEQSNRQAANAYIERQKEFAKATPDFFKVMEDADIAVPTPVMQDLLRIPDGPLIAYHMAKNPDLAKQFFEQPREMHGFLLGQLAATLKSPQKSTNAPAPGKPAASKAGSDNEPPSDPEKYRAWADKHLK